MYKDIPLSFKPCQHPRPHPAPHRQGTWARLKIDLPMQRLETSLHFRTRQRLVKGVLTATAMVDMCKTKSPTLGVFSCLKQLNLQAKEQLVFSYTPGFSGLNLAAYNLNLECFATAHGSWILIHAFWLPPRNTPRTLDFTTSFYRTEKFSKNEGARNQLKNTIQPTLVHPRIFRPECCSAPGMFCNCRLRIVFPGVLAELDMSGPRVQEL